MIFNKEYSPTWPVMYLLIEIPFASTKEWHIVAMNYERVGKFGLNPVYCSEGVTRTEVENCYTWMLND